MALSNQDILFQSKPNKLTFFIAIVGIGISILFFYQMHPSLTFEQPTKGIVMAWALASIFIAMLAGGVWLALYSLSKITVTKEYFIISYPFGFHKRIIPLSGIIEITTRFMSSEHYSSYEGVIRYNDGQKALKAKVSTSQFKGFWKALNLASKISGVKITEAATEHNKLPQLDKEEVKPTNDRKGIIKDWEYLLAAVGVFFLWMILLMWMDSGIIVQNDIVGIRSRLKAPPLLFEASDYDELQLQLDGYDKTFTIGGFSLKSICYDPFVERAEQGDDIVVFIENSDTTELNVKYKINNKINVYQVELEGKQYISIDLFNELKRLNYSIRHYALVVSLICLLYSFIYKPRIGAWLPILLVLGLFLYWSFQEEKSAYIKYDPCIEVYEQ